MSIAGTINAGVSKAAKCVKDGMDNCKIDGQIAEWQKRIKTLTKEIGNLAIIRLEAGDQMSPEIMERYEAIKEARAMIEELDSSKVKDEGTYCPACGMKAPEGMKFCGACGTSLDAIIEEEKEDEIVEV